MSRPRHLLTQVLDSYWAFYAHLHPREVRAEALRFRTTFHAGAISLILFLFLVVSGILLMYFFIPHEESAWSSIRALEERSRVGALLRTSHNVAGQLMLVSVGVHLASLVLRRAHERRKLANWIIGVVLFLLTVALSYTGYLLPFDQLAYWATTVGSHMAGSAPTLGRYVQEIVFGGETVTNVTLLRFYVHHCVTFPVVFVLLLWIHLYRIRKDKGLRLREPLREPDIWIRTRPDMLRWELWIAALVTVTVLFLSLIHQVPLGPEADPSVTPNPMKAPWYLIGLQELLHFHHPFVASYVVPFATLAFLAAIPLLPDTLRTSPVSELSRRGAAMLSGIFIGSVLVALLLSYVPNVTLLITSVAFLGLANTIRRRSWLGRRLGNISFTTLILLYLAVTYGALSLVALLWRGPGWRFQF